MKITEVDIPTQQKIANFLNTHPNEVFTVKELNQLLHITENSINYYKKARRLQTVATSKGLVFGCTTALAKLRKQMGVK